jgi:hypothetical protein
LNIDWAAGALLVGLPIAFNLFFFLLGRSFDYPRILRSPVGTILSRFQAGRLPLKLLWYGFMLTAVLLAPLAVLLGQVLARDGLESTVATGGHRPAVGSGVCRPSGSYRIQGARLALRADGIGEAGVPAKANLTRRTCAKPPTPRSMCSTGQPRSGPTGAGASPADEVHLRRRPWARL